MLDVGEAAMGQYEEAFRGSAMGPFGSKNYLHDTLPIGENTGIKPFSG